MRIVWDFMNQREGCVMNHRQWKKKFKKEHGRNPNIFEDKKLAGHKLAVALNTTDLSEIIRGLGEELCRATNCMVEAFRYALADIGQKLVDAFGEEANTDENSN